jgi:hypothetical protein
LGVIELLEGQIELVLNEHYEADGAIVFREACKLGCEVIGSKRLGSIYRRGRSPHCVKGQNPNVLEGNYLAHCTDPASLSLSIRPTVHSS